MTREEFMNIVYNELHSDGDNYRANRIIDAADEYAETEQEVKNDKEINLQDISQAVLKMWVDKMISDSEYKMLERRIEVMKL